MFNTITAKKAKKNVIRHEMNEPKRDIKDAKWRLSQILKDINNFSKNGVQQMSERCKLGYETEFISRKLLKKGFKVEVERIAGSSGFIEKNRMTISW